MKFKEFIDVRDGTHSSPKSVKKGHHLVTTKNLKMNYIDFSKSNIISNTDFEEINRRSKVEQYDILLSMIGTVGNVYQERHKSINYAIKNVALLKFHGDELLSDWMNYFLQSMVGRNLITSRLSGSTQQFISLNDLRNLEIELPSRSKMKEIITPLMIIDRKMMSNKQINANLLSVLKAYFNNFLSENELVAVELNKIADIKAGGDKPNDIVNLADKDHMIPVFSNGVTNEGLYGYTSKPKILTKAVTVSARGTIGFTCLRETPYFPIVRLISVIPMDSRNVYYIFLWLLNKNIQGFGTTQQQLTVPVFKKYSILMPKNSELLNNFSKHVTPLFNLMKQNKNENDTLNSIKSLLLNRLF